MPPTSNVQLITSHIADIQRSLISTEQCYIYISSFTISSPYSHYGNPTAMMLTYQLLAAAAARGCDTRIMFAAKARLSSALLLANTIAKLDNGHLIKLRGASSGGILHAKLLITSQALILGSHNFTQSSHRNPKEISILVRDPVIIQQATRYYTNLWTIAGDIR